jgi:arabinose-5-phosphate isomerase
LLLTLSYSGESDELITVIAPAKRLGVPVASFTCSKETSLAQYCDITVPMSVPREACPFNLAPTTTSTAQLALGDALAMTLLSLRKFTKEDYGRLHPGGAIGKAVTMRVSDVMRTGERIAIIDPESSVKDTLLKITKARCGSAVVVDGDGRLLGIFCDSDFRRHAENDLEVLSRKVSEVMTKKPASICQDSLAVEVLKIIEKRKIDDIIVTDADGRVVGLVDIQDLPGLKLM